MGPIWVSTETHWLRSGARGSGEAVWERCLQSGHRRCMYFSAHVHASRARLAEYSNRYQIFVPPFSVAYASYVSCARGQMWPRVHLRGRARAHTARALKRR